MRTFSIVAVLMSSFLSLASAEAARPAASTRKEAAKATGVKGNLRLGRSAAGAWSPTFAGQEKARAQIEQFERVASYQLARGDTPRAAFVITGKIGAGATTLSREMARRFAKLGVLESDEVVRINAAELVRTGVTGFIGDQSVRVAISNAMRGSSGKMVVLEDAGELARMARSEDVFTADAAWQAIHTMTAEYAAMGKPPLVVLEGRNRDEMAQLKNMDPAFARRFFTQAPLELDATPSVARFLGESTTVKVFGISGSAKRELAKAMPHVGVTRPNGDMRSDLNSFDLRVARERIQRAIRAGGEVPRREEKVNASDVKRALSAMKADEAEWAAAMNRVAERRAARK